MKSFTGSVIEIILLNFTSCIANNIADSKRKGNRSNDYLGLDLGNNFADWYEVFV